MLYKCVSVIDCVSTNVFQMASLLDGEDITGMYNQLGSVQGFK